MQSGNIILFIATGLASGRRKKRKRMWKQDRENGVEPVSTFKVQFFLAWMVCAIAARLITALRDHY